MGPVLNQPIADVADTIDHTFIYRYARLTLRLPHTRADAFAAWLDRNLNDWGPDHAPVRDVLVAAHQTWISDQ